MTNTMRVLYLCLGLAIGAFAVSAFAAPNVPTPAVQPPPNPCGNHGNNCNPGDPYPPELPPRVVVPVTNSNTNENNNSNLNLNSNLNENINLNNNSNQQSQSQSATAGASASSGATSIANGGNASAQGGAGGNGGNGGNGYGGHGGNSNVSVGAGASTANSGNNTGTANVVVQGDQAQERNPVSTAIAPTVITGNDQCLVPVSVGGQGIGFGLSFGVAVKDENCEVLKLSARLTVMGHADAALMMLRQDPRVDAALKAVGK